MRPMADEDRWSLQHGMVSLPKSIMVERMAENGQVDGFVITAEDLAAMDGLNEHMVTDWYVLSQQLACTNSLGTRQTHHNAQRAELTNSIIPTTKAGIGTVDPWN